MTSPFGIFFDTPLAHPSRHLAQSTWHLTKTWQMGYAWKEQCCHFSLVYLSSWKVVFNAICGWDRIDGWMVIIGHRSPKSTFGTNKLLHSYAKFRTLKFYISMIIHRLSIAGSFSQHELFDSILWLHLMYNIALFSYWVWKWYLRENRYAKWQRYKIWEPHQFFSKIIYFY